LLFEYVNVGKIAAIESDVVVMELDISQPPGRALVEEEVVVFGSILAGEIIVLLGIEEIVGHKFDDQGNVDVDGAFKFGQGADVPGRHLKVGVALEALGGDHVPEEVNDLLALESNLHFDHGVIEQVTPVVGRGAGAFCVGIPGYHRGCGGCGCFPHRQSGSFVRCGCAERLLPDLRFR